MYTNTIHLFPAGEKQEDFDAAESDEARACRLGQGLAAEGLTFDGIAIGLAVAC